MAKSSNMMLSWVMRGRLDRSLIKSARETAKHIDSIKKSASSLGKQFSALSGPLRSVKTAMIGSVAGAIPALMLIAKNTADAGNNIDKMSQKLGLSAQTMSGWVHAANMSCVSTEAFGTNLLKLNRQISAAATGNKSAQLAFKRAGVNIRDSAGELKTADQIMLEMSDTFKKMPEGIYKSDLAMAVFGKSGADMLPLLQGGSESIKKLISQADELGTTFTDADAAASAEFCDNLDLLKKSIVGVKNTIGKQLIPIISPLLKSFAQWISANRQLISTKLTDWLNKIKKNLPEIKKFLTDAFNGIRSFASGVDTAVSALGGWQPVLKNTAKIIATIQAIKFSKWIYATAKSAIVLGKSIKTLIPVVIKFGIALLANPIGMVIAAIAALVAAGYLLYKNWDKITKFIKNMWTSVKKYFSETFSSITKSFDDGFINGILNLLKNFNPVTLVTRAVDAIFKYFTGISLVDEGSKLIKSFGDGIVNTWQLIKKSVINTFTGWMPGWLKNGFRNVGVDIDAVRANVGIDNIDAHHANGAIVRHRQIAEIGEDGPEAVIPLTKPVRGRQLLMQSAKIMGLNLQPAADSKSYAPQRLINFPVTQQNASGFFSNIQKKTSSLITKNRNSGLIDELTNGLAQTINNNQKTSFSPSFNPTITINGVSNSDDIGKKLKKILDEQQRNFVREFENYNYQRKRVGVF